MIVLVAAGSFVMFPRGSSTAGDRIAWFDAPEDGDQVTTGRVTIAAGATDPVGVAVLELSINDEFQEGRLYEGAPERVEAEFAWLPNVEGTFRLTVRARGTDGVWGSAETIVVTAAHRHPSEDPLSPQAATSTTTTTITTTTTTAPPSRPSATTTTTTAAPLPTSAPPTAAPAPSTTVAATECEPTQPSLRRPRDEAVVSDPPVLEWEYRGEDPCRPDQQTLRFTGPTGSGGGELWVDLPRWATSWRPPRLENCTTYSWKVFAVVDGAELKSAIRTFRTDFSDGC